MKPHADALTQLLTSIDGQSAVISSAKWGKETAQQEKAISGGNQIEAPFGVACPVPEKNHVNSDFFPKSL